MRKFIPLRFLLQVLVLLSFGVVSEAQFTPGNISVLQAASSSANNTTFNILELAPSVQVSPVNTIAINGTTGLNALRTSGSAATTGYLSNTSDGSLLCFAGHNSTTTSGNANTIAARGVGTLNAAGDFSLATTYTGVSGNQTRCATSIDNVNWIVGDQGGIYTNGGSAASPAGNYRGTKSFGNTAYVFQASASAAPVSSISAPSGGTLTALPGLANGASSLQDFYVVSSGSNGAAYDVLYILGATSTTVGTLSKYSLVSGSWVANGSYATAFGGFGLAAAKQGSGAYIYITTGTGSTAANSVIQLNDEAGYNTEIAINTVNNVTLYTTPAGTTLKGVAFAPVAAKPTMRITEFMYDAVNLEFIEFTNTGTMPVDMTGWSFDDDSRIAGTVSLSAFGTVQPGESVVLAENNAASFRTAWGLCSGVKVIGGLATNLGRSDEINLFNESGTLADRLTYSDQNIAGSIRTQNKSGSVSAAGLGVNNILYWNLSAVADAEGSYAAAGGDIGTPGKSTRSLATYNPCTVPVTTATIAIDVVATTDYLDAGVVVSPAGPFAVSGVIGDPSDPAATLGIDFTIGDNVVPVDDLIVTASSSNTAVLANSGLVLTGTGTSRNLKITPAGAGYSNVTVTVNNGTTSVSYIINYAASVPVVNNAGWSTGVADASAAIALDDNYMVIANDESNFFYVYNRNASGLPVKTFDFNAGNILALTDGSTNNWKEVDVEAVTASVAQSGRSYWLGSMSNSSSFNDKPDRNRIFAIDIAGTGAATTFSNAGYYGDLRSQLINWGDANGYNFTASAAPGKDPKLIDGFNAEGMVFAPDNTTLYIGLRAPLVPLANRTKAVIAPVQNFEAWFNNGTPSGTPVLGTPIELDLGSRGIRDMIRLSNGNYVIIAGSYDGTLRPAVFRWTGNPSDAPVLLSSFDLTGLNAEAVLPVKESGVLSLEKLQIICDNGDDILYNDGVAAKDLSQDSYRKFISTISISAVGGVLPVYFESFTAQRKLSDVILNWKDGAPGTAESFDVMRSENGNDFSRIRTVSAYRGQTTYTFIDIQAPSGKLYYRMKANEPSGRNSLSTVRIINPDGADRSLVKVYPNPVTSSSVFSIVVNQPGVKTVDIYNSNGTLYKRITFSDTAKDISTGNWAKGYYLLRINTANNNVVTQKIIVE